MMEQLKDPLNEGPDMIKSIKSQPEQIRGPNLVQIYQAPKKKMPPPILDAGFASHTMNNTVTKEILDSLGGIKDTIRPIASSLTTHELRPYELQIDYKQTLNDLRREDQESMLQSMSCLKGEPIDAPRPLYSQRDLFLEEGDNSNNGINMIGKARLVSASPFRASIKLDPNQRKLNKDSDEEEDLEFQREEILPELQKQHQSPIKDDSELLRAEKNDLLTSFSQLNNPNAGGLRKSDEAMSHHSECTPKAAGGDLKGIMIHETTRTSFDKVARNSAQY